MRHLLSLLVVLPLAAFAEVDRTAKPAPGPSPEAAFPDYTTTALSNGLKVFVIEDDRKPTITLRLMLKAGDALDGDKSGLANFAATLLNRGTTKLDASAFAKAVDSLGAQLEASSGEDATSVTMSGLVKSTDALLELFSDAIRDPVFPADEFAKEQKRTLSALAAQKKSPAALVGNLMNKVLFGAHPYGNITTPESVQGITRDDIVAFHKKWFAPNNASLVVVGDMKAADITPRLEKVFGTWARKELPAVKKSPVPEHKGLTIHLLDRPGSVQSSIIVTHIGPPRKNPYLPELNVVNATLGGGFSGRLFQNLREKHGYTYGSSSAFGFNADAGYFQATAESRNEVTAPAVHEILAEMKRIREEPIPEPELELQRQYNVGNYLLSLENAGRVATRVQDIELYGLDPDFYKTYANRMSAVTADKARELAQKYITPTEACVIVVGEAKQVRADLEKLGKVTVYDTDYHIVP